MDRTHSCPGYRASAVAAAIRKAGRPDLGMIVSDRPAAVAGVFTTNQVKAAPVLLDMERIPSGICRAVVANSGNANCCTGPAGMRDARTMTRLVADDLGLDDNQVLVASTGVIGEPMPMERVQAAVRPLVGALNPQGFSDFARAIMTTDTEPKAVTRSAAADGGRFSLTAVAKGAGMICPNMATMLCFVCADIDATAAMLAPMLRQAVDGSFNRITVDGDMSTNDTVLLMANGASGLSLEDGNVREVFQCTLDEVLLTLARSLVRDGEGASKVVEVSVRGAADTVSARRIADTVANSPLVKTAFFGEDANWGRILAAAGRSGVAFAPERVDVFFDDVQMVKAGVGCGADAEQEAAEVLRRPEFTVVLDLHAGRSAASVLTCDFSLDYVRINADYRS
jgi:glutamate N-acetyltransferase/amino-acid N-acetyltransferase